MDKAEAIAFEFLKTIVGGDIAYEPDGNVPPDFSVNGQIAVEVRRLSQIVEVERGVESLEVSAIPLQNTVRRVLESLGPSNTGKSWFVSFRFGRPLPAKRDVERDLGAFLLSFREGEPKTRTQAKLPCGLSVRLSPASDADQNEFLLGGYTDKDSGGWLLHELEQSLSLCIAEKSAKTAAYRARYQEWWLVLIDHVGYGLAKYDQDLFRSRVRIEHDWSRVILVDPRSHLNWFEYTVQ